MRWLELVCFLLLFSLTGGLVSPVNAQRKQVESGRDAEYVSMGSSYAAGPGLGERVSGSPETCAQSSVNYAHLLAGTRRLHLVDVSCSGATTADVLEGRQDGLPAQVDAVRPETKLVTVTIGGNDVFFVGNLFGWSCQNTPLRLSQAPCRMTPEATVDTAFDGLEAHLKLIVERVHARSPLARVIFVDYITVVPAAGSCPARLPLTREEQRLAHHTAVRLAALTARAAQASGAGLVRASALTADHDVCSPDPWVSGIDVPQSTSAFRRIPYHPTEAAMRVIAEELNRVLGPIR